jgi:hypothetical protein
MPLVEPGRGSMRISLSSHACPLVRFSHVMAAGAPVDQLSVMTSEAGKSSGPRRLRRYSAHLGASGGYGSGCVALGPVASVVGLITNVPALMPARPKLGRNWGPVAGRISPLGGRAPNR